MVSSYDVHPDIGEKVVGIVEVDSQEGEVAVS